MSDGLMADGGAWTQGTPAAWTMVDGPAPVGRQGPSQLASCNWNQNSSSLKLPSQFSATTFVFSE